MVWKGSALRLSGVGLYQPTLCLPSVGSAILKPTSEKEKGALFLGHGAPLGRIIPLKIDRIDWFCCFLWIDIKI
jgi:hypothetical protein